MESFELLGFAAGIFSICSLLPQIIKSLKTKSTRDISFEWTLINVLGQILWALYGLLTHSPSLILTSSITTVTSASVFFLKIKNS